ncbi:transporter substrate-binding domain-containing protein [Nitratireductor sp. GCM10026969]|uniref:transporter substrate-binding domain-containing protein n=1 Tax=Nitratireductor sp. GCM10026969 TaxID=3252645 RepID=UPI0036104536
MAPKCYQVGLLFSTSGPYSVVAQSMLNGALLALEQVNAEPEAGVRLEPVMGDPGGANAEYARLAREMLNDGIRHVVGCYTSSSRKEVIPFFEKHDALLWYPSHYEGFEASANVVYTGAAPNQHILPLTRYLVEEYGKHAFCVGSNYIWAWENNRILRETLLANGGEVIAERYLPVGETDFDPLIEKIVDARPSFVFNTLIGTSAYHFFRTFRAACQKRGIDQAREIPVASCSLSEPELEEIGPDAVDGHLSSSVYFSTIDSAANARFIEAYRARFPAGPTMSADAEATFIAVRLLSDALRSAGSDAIDPVREAVGGAAITAPQGRVSIDRDSRHACLTPRIGRSNGQARFDIILESSRPVRPDPYLIESAPRYTLVARRPNLRIVS